MKGMKGRFLKKLRFISSIGTLRKGSLVPHHNITDKLSHKDYVNLLVSDELDHAECNLTSLSLSEKAIERNGHYVEDGDMELGINASDKDHFSSSPESAEAGPETETDEFLLPGLEASTDSETSSVQFEPNPTSAIEKLDTEDIETEKQYPSLLDFPEKCPPGGNDSVILYTTTLRGIRKTFADCTAVRFLLTSLKVHFYERDVSLDLGYREELWNILGDRVIPPKFFIKGRYIGGADEVIALHEQGKLKKLLEGIPINHSDGTCDRCANVGFLICSNCHGSCRIMMDSEKDDELYIRCAECNENGLVKCPNCC